eukprot:TRINITY_DN5517_c0_g1_i4.p1 TRINITY_DN5517_c0_g1~~TRINITY_DN5517_c0_g1_i4.p1  ORF type:complete len:131 (+),score=1.36 TRINITY_DN5517_c0_g1_i4:448-840(+)
MKIHLRTNGLPNLLNILHHSYHIIKLTFVIQFSLVIKQQKAYRQAPCIILFCISSIVRVLMFFVSTISFDGCGFTLFSSNNFVFCVWIRDVAFFCNSSSELFNGVTMFLLRSTSASCIGREPSHSCRSAA